MPASVLPRAGNPLLDLNGKVALVTGAGGGIGRAVVLELSALGARVAVSDIDEDKAAETVALAESAGGELLLAPCDVSDAASVQSAIDAIVARFGRIDLAHNNAGLDSAFAPITEMDEAVFDRGIAVNLKGLWLCLRAELRLMIAQGVGAIVNTASVVGLGSAPMAAAYGAAKSGVLSLTRTAALENLDHNIRVNAICPGLTRTAMGARVIAEIPSGEAVVASMRRLGEPEDMARAVAFLLSDASAYINGQHLTIDGGYSLR